MGFNWQQTWFSVRKDAQQNSREFILIARYIERAEFMARPRNGLSHGDATNVCWSRGMAVYFDGSTTKPYVI